MPHQISTVRQISYLELIDVLDDLLGDGVALRVRVDGPGDGPGASPLPRHLHHLRHTVKLLLALLRALAGAQILLPSALTAPLLWTGKSN